MKGLSRENPSLIGFVVDCRASSAITFEEFIEWCFYMIKQYDDLPTYMYYLVDCKNLSEVREVIGFNVFPDINEKESEAVWGIAAKRGVDIEERYERMITRKKALKRLEQYPHIEKRFRETFPFIDL